MVYLHTNTHNYTSVHFRVGAMSWIVQISEFHVYLYRYSTFCMPDCCCHSQDPIMHLCAGLVSPPLFHSCETAPRWKQWRQICVSVSTSSRQTCCWSVLVKGTYLWITVIVSTPHDVCLNLPKWTTTFLQTLFDNELIHRFLWFVEHVL